MTIVRVGTSNEVQGIGPIFRQRSLARAVSAALVLGLTLNAGIVYADATKNKDDTSNMQSASAQKNADVVAQADTSTNTQTQTDEDAQSTQGTDASAQSNQQNQDQLSTVTVTANKRQEGVQQVQTAVTAQTGDQLQDKDVGRSASEVLTYVPNASAGTQQHGRPRWWIRGIGAGQQQWDLSNPVGFYQDDVYISNTTSTGYPLFDLDRVEVLRGPQGTLWGKNTTGGAINVIAKAPSLDEDDKSQYLKFDYSSFQDRIEEGAINGVIVPERLAGRISFHQEDEAGPFHDAYQDTRAGGLADGAIRGQLLFIVNDDIEALLNVHYRKYTTNGAITTTQSYAQNGAYANGSPYTASTDPTVVSTNTPSWSNVEQLGESLNVKWQLGRYALTSITGWEGFTNESVGDGDNTPIEASSSHVFGQSHQFSEEVRLASPREDRWNWLGGLHFFDENINYDSQSAILAGVPALAYATTGASYSNSSLDHHDKSYAIFGSTTYNFTDRLDGTLGLRWTNETKKYDLNNKVANTVGASSNFSNLLSFWNSYTGAYAVNPYDGSVASLTSGTFNAGTSKTWSVFTYDGTVGYKLTDDQRVYVKYAYGFKSGGFNTAATNLASVYTVAPEKLRDYEAGYKSEWFDHRLTFNATAFHYDYRDVQVNVVGVNSVTNTTISYLQNAAKAHVNGAEFEIEALPIRNLHTFANVGLLHSRYDKFDILNNGGNNAGGELVRSPHETIQLGADYTIPLENGSHFLVGGDARYVSKQFYYVALSQQSQGRHYLWQPSYTLANFRVEYATPGDAYVWTVYTLNAFNKQYEQHALPGNAVGANPTAGSDSVYWAQPRVVGVSVTAHW